MKLTERKDGITFEFFFCTHKCEENDDNVGNDD